MTIVELFSKRFSMNGIDTPSLCDKLDNNNNDNWYVFGAYCSIVGVRVHGSREYPNCRLLWTRYHRL